MVMLQITSKIFCQCVCVCVVTVTVPNIVLN